MNEAMSAGLPTPGSTVKVVTVSFQVPESGLVYADDDQDKCCVIDCDSTVRCELFLGQRLHVEVDENDHVVQARLPD